jgi:hypothetical protein
MSNFTYLCIYVYTSLILIKNIDLLLLVQKLRPVGTRSNNRGNHMDICKERAINVNIAEQTTHIIATKKI